MRLMVAVYFEPAHFNRNCQSHLPDCWTAEVVDGLKQPQSGHTYAYYNDDTRDGALKGLIADLQARGLHGTIRLV